MPFTFFCPQGHLLEGHESQQGTQGRCPNCASVFVFPMAGASGGSGPVTAAAPQPAFEQAYGPGPQQSPTFQAPAPMSRILRIVCPRGHELPTPEDLIGTTTICPYCNAQVVVAFENSAEHRQQQQAIAKQREEESSRFGLRIAMIALLIVGGAFGALVFFIMKNR